MCNAKWQGNKSNAQECLLNFVSQTTEDNKKKIAAHPRRFGARDWLSVHTGVRARPPFTYLPSYLPPPPLPAKECYSTFSLPPPPFTSHLWLTYFGSNMWSVHWSADQPKVAIEELNQTTCSWNRLSFMWKCTFSTASNNVETFSFVLAKEILRLDLYFPVWNSLKILTRNTRYVNFVLTIQFNS